MKCDSQRSLQFAILLLSLIATIYVTIAIHRYLYVITFGILQFASLLYYLSSFVPGGQRGLYILLQTGYAILLTLIRPFVFIVTKFIQMCLRRIIGS